MRKCGRVGAGYRGRGYLIEMRCRVWVFVVRNDASKRPCVTAIAMMMVMNVGDG
jgi:hypothetical protein